jgi:hypothetical protein
MVRRSASGNVNLIARMRHMDKQLFAKVGVFVLLGLNVGAYYVFWPGQKNAPRHETKGQREEKGEVALLPTKPETPTSAKPKEFPVGSLDNVVALPPPVHPKLADQEIKPDEAVNRLLDHIKNETETAKVVLPPPLPGKVDPAAFPSLRDETKPKPLPPIEAQPLLKDPNIGVTSALTPKLPTPWVFQIDKFGNQTLLIAKLRQPGSDQFAAEFRIVCDRAERNGPDGDLQAFGKVTFSGAGLKGVCQRLTVPSLESRIQFEDQVSIVQDLNAGGSLRGDRFTWELAVEPKMPLLGGPR